MPFNERVVEGIYRKLLTITRKLVGRGTTFAIDLERVAKTLFGSKFAGVFAADKQRRLNSEVPYQILNLDKSNEPGSHWIALAWTPKGVLVYDSFGRHTDKIIKLKQRNFDTDHDAEQKITEMDCGARTLAWLMLFERLGPKAAILI